MKDLLLLTKVTLRFVAPYLVLMVIIMLLVSPWNQVLQMLQNFLIPEKYIHDLNWKAFY
jgi:hypothetical protein